MLPRLSYDIITSKMLTIFLQKCSSFNSPFLSPETENINFSEDKKKKTKTGIPGLDIQ